MEFEATEIQEFNIYLKVAKVLLHDLDNLTDQTKAAQWVQTLGPGLPTRKYQTRLMLSYMKLLVCALLRKKLVEPFTNSPGTYLDEAYGNLKLTDMWLTVSKSAWLARSGGGEPSPCHVEVSGDRQQYACVQRVADGAQCYFAISAAQKLERWNNAAKAHLPKVYKTDNTKIDLPPLPDLKPLPDDALLEQKLTQKDIQKAKDVLKRIKDRDATKKEQSSPPPSEAMDIPVTPLRRYSLPWDKIEAGIPPTMSPSDPEYVDMSQAKYPAGYIKDYPTKGGSMDWGRRRKYIQKPFSPEKSSGDERRVLENITEASVLEPTLGQMSDLSHISQEELSLYDSFRDNLEDSQRKKVAFGDAKLYVPHDSIQHEMPEYRRPLSRISEKSESSIPRESMGPLVQSPLYTPKFPDSLSSPHLQKSPDTPGMFSSPGSLRSTPRSIRTPGSLPHTTGSFLHTPGSLPSTPGSYYPDSPGLLPFTPVQRQDESLRRRMMRTGMDSSQESKDDSRDFYKKLGYSNIGAYLDGIMPETVPVVPERPVVVTPHDESWERRLAEVGQDEDRSYRWLGGGFFDMEDRDTEAQIESQADFNRHLAGLENMIQVPESPTQDNFGPWVQELQRHAHDASEENASVLAPQPSASAMSPRDRATRRTRPTTLSSPALFRRGMGGRDRKYRPSEFGLTGEEHWTAAEAYFRGSIEPIFDPDERAVDRIIRFIDGSMLEDEGMDFSSVLEDSVPDWERPSWPGRRFTIPQIHPDQEGPMPVSPGHPSREGTYPDFDSNVLPDDMLDPDHETFDTHFSLSGLNTSVFDNVLENEPRSDPRTLFRRRELSDYENLEDETPLDIPIANASVDDSSTSDQSEIPSHLWASELHRLKSTWKKLQGSVSGPLTESHLEIQDESFPHSEFIQTLPSISTSPDRLYRQLQDESFPHSEVIRTPSSFDRSHLQFQDESFPHSEFIETPSSIAGSFDRSHLQFQDESFPHSEFIQTPSSIVGSFDRSHLQFQDESFPHSEFIQTPSSLGRSFDRSHPQFQDESFPHSEFIQTTSSLAGSFDRSHLHFQDESFPHSEFIQTLPSIDESVDRSHLQFQDESFPRSQFIQTPSSKAGSFDRSHLQLQDESFPHSEFIRTLPSIDESLDRPHLQFQDESFPHSKFISTPSSVAGSSYRSHLQLQDESFPHSEFIRTLPSIDESVDRQHLQFQDESFPHSQFIQTSSSIAESPERFGRSPPHNFSARRRQSQSSGATEERVIAPRRSSSAPVRAIGSSTQTDYGLDAQWNRLLQGSLIDLDDEELPSFKSITEDSLPRNDTNFNVSNDFMRDVESRLVPEPPLLPEILGPGIDDLTGISLVLDDSSTLGNETFANSTMISATSPPQFYTAIDESYPTDLSMANTSMISSTSIPNFMSSIDDDSQSNELRRMHGTPESATRYIPPHFTLPSPRRVEVKKQHKIPVPGTENIPTRYTGIESGQAGSHYRGKRRNIPRSQIRPRRIIFEETASSIGESPGVRMLEDESDLQLVDDFSYAHSVEMRNPGVRMLEDESDLQFVDDSSYAQRLETRTPGSDRVSISPRMHVSNRRYDLALPDISGELLDNITAPSFRSYESSGLPNASMLSTETQPSYPTYMDRSVSGNISRETPLMLSSYIDEYTPEMISMETPPSFDSYGDHSILQYSRNIPIDSMPTSSPTRRRSYQREHTGTSRTPATPRHRRVPALIHRTPESAKQYIPPPFSLPSPVRYEQKKPHRTFAAPAHSTPKRFSSISPQTRPQREQRTIIPRRLHFTQEESSFPEPTTRISLLEDQSQPEFAVSYDGSSLNMDSKSLPAFSANYNQTPVGGIRSSRGLAGTNVQDRIGQTRLTTLTDQNNASLLEDETAPDFASSYNQSGVESVNQSQEHAVPSRNQSQRRTRGRFSVSDLSSKQMLEDETAPDFASIYDQSISFGQRGPFSLPDQSSVQMLDEETMPSFQSSYYDQSASFDVRRRLSLPNQSSIQMLDEETMPSLSPRYYDQSASLDTRRRLSLPDQSSVQMLDDETMPSFSPSYYDQSASFDTRRPLSLPDRSSVQMLDEETMPSFSPSFSDQSSSFDKRRPLSLPDQSSVQMLDEETMPSFSPSYYDQSASFDTRRRLSLPDQSSVQMLDEESMPSFSPSYNDQSTSFDRRRRLSLPNQSSVRMLDEETMPSFQSSYYDQSASFDRSRLLSLADQSSVQMLDEESMPSFATSYHDQSFVDNRGRLSLQDQSSLRMLDQESMPSFASSYNQSRNFTLPDQSYVQRLEDETEPDFASSYEQSSCGNKSCRKDSTGTQMLEDESQPYFDSIYSESPHYPDSSRDYSERLVNRGRDRRRRLSPTTYGHVQTASRQIRDSPRQINHPSFTEEQLNDITPPSLYMRQSVSIPDNSMISNESPYYFSSFDSVTPSQEMYNNSQQRRRLSNVYSPANRRVMSTSKTPESFRKYVRPPFTLPSPVRFQTPERNRFVQGSTSTPQDRTASFRRTQTRRASRNDFSLPQLLETDDRLIQDETDPNIVTFDSDTPSESTRRAQFIPEYRQIHRTPRQSPTSVHWTNLPDASGEQLDDISDRILSTSTFTINDPSTPQNLSKSQCTVCPGNSQTRVQGTRGDYYLYRDENYVPFDEANALSPFHDMDSIASDDLSSIHTSREYSFFE